MKKIIFASMLILMTTHGFSEVGPSERKDAVEGPEAFKEIMKLKETHATQKCNGGIGCVEYNSHILYIVQQQSSPGSSPSVVGFTVLEYFQVQDKDGYIRECIAENHSSSLERPSNLSFSCSTIKYN